MLWYFNRCLKETFRLRRCSALLLKKLSTLKQCKDGEHMIKRHKNQKLSLFLLSRSVETCKCDKLRQVAMWLYTLFAAGN